VERKKERGKVSGEAKSLYELDKRLPCSRSLFQKSSSGEFLRRAAMTEGGAFLASPPYTSKAHHRDHK